MLAEHVLSTSQSRVSLGEWLDKLFFYALVSAASEQQLAQRGKRLSVSYELAVMEEGYQRSKMMHCKLCRTLLAAPR